MILTVAKQTSTYHKVVSVGSERRMCRDRWRTGQCVGRCLWRMTAAIPASTPCMMATMASRPRKLQGRNCTSSSPTSWSPGRGMVHTGQALLHAAKVLPHAAGSLPSILVSGGRQHGRASGQHCWPRSWSRISSFWRPPLLQATQPAAQQLLCWASGSATWSPMWGTPARCSAGAPALQVSNMPGITAACMSRWCASHSWRGQCRGERGSGADSGPHTRQAG